MIAQPISVSELTRYLQELLAEDETLADLWIEGEIVESVTSRAGHVFFTFADEEARLRCVMFRGAAVRQSYIPVVGQSCAAHGNVSIYAREGQYQLYVDFVRPAGIGLAALEFELLKQRLQAEGLFEQSRKRPLPDRIHTIGIVTSAEGAVRHDIANVVSRRNPFVHLILSPAAVQGDAAPESLRLALERLLADGRADAIIIGRGGGSVSDLSAFNDEALVRAVYASPVPVVSAVGHETDWTLLDLVADLRAPTPSAAAELCTYPVAQTLGAVSALLGRLRGSFVRDAAERMLRVNELRDALVRLGPTSEISALQARVDDLTTHLAYSVAMATQRRIANRALLRQSLVDRTDHRLHGLRQRVSANGGLLDVLNPHATLARGYAALTDTASGMPVLSTVAVSKNQALTAHLRDGVVRTVVTAIE